MRPLMLLSVLLLGQAATAHADAYDKLARALAARVDGLAHEKVAVLPFAYTDGRTSPGGTIVSEGLATAIVERGKMVLVERNLLSKAMEEIKLSYTGMITTASAAQAGRMVGAKFLVVGTLSDVTETKVEVNARLIRTETGEVLSAAKERLKKEWKDAAEPIKDGRSPEATLKVQTVNLPKPEEGDAILKQVGERKLALRYSDSDGNPSIAFTDYTQKDKPATTVVRIPFYTEKNQFGRMDTKFSLGGVRYRFWTGVWKADSGPVLHLAPTRGFFSSGYQEDKETIVDFLDLSSNWVRDVDKHGHYLGNVDNLDLVAYFEFLPNRGLMISIWRLTSDNGNHTVDPTPLEHLALTGRWGREVASRIVVVGSRHFRFRYDLDAATVAVEELQ